MGKKYIIDSDYLLELISTNSKSLVGKVMKRFELSSNLTDIKTQTRELIYESYRDFAKLLESHQFGYDQKVWDFKQKGKE
jgi:septin family protein